VCHSIGFQIKNLEKAIEKFIDQNSDTYKQLYDKVTKQKKRVYKNAEVIFIAMLKLDSEEVTHSEILAEIHKIIPQYPQGNLSTYLQKLCSSKFDEVLRIDENSGKYSFSDPMFKAYVYMKLKGEIKITEKSPFIKFFEAIGELVSP
jgi:hypothetical protein